MKTGTRLLGEASVVVASILLAFAIDAGWDQRQEREDEREVLRGLQAELVEARATIRASRDSTEQAFERLSHLVTAPRAEILTMSPSQAAHEVFTPLTRQWADALPTGALDAATGSGQLASISDPTLRAALARLGGAYASVEAMGATIGEMDARTVAILGEFEGIRSMWDGSGPSIDIRTLEALLDDRRVMGAATAKLWFVGGYLFELQKFTSIVDDSIELIAAVLED
jgi:hypothetical protein